VGLFALAGPFLSIYFGGNYRDASMTLQILVFGTFFLGIPRVVTPVLHATGWVRPSEFITVAGLFINILLNIILIPKYGIIGAGVGTSASYFAIFIGNVILWYYSSFDIVPLNWVGKLGGTQAIFAVLFIGIVRLADFPSLVTLLIFPPTGLIIFLIINIFAGYIPIKPAKPYLRTIANFLS
jgi:O-antigen/teichoic acid export membrane protein